MDCNACENIMNSTLNLNWMLVVFKAQPFLHLALLIYIICKSGRPVCPSLSHKAHVHFQAATLQNQLNQFLSPHCLKCHVILDNVIPIPHNYIVILKSEYLEGYYFGREQACLKTLRKHYVSRAQSWRGSFGLFGQLQLLPIHPQPLSFLSCHFLDFSLLQLWFSPVDSAVPQGLWEN